MTYLGLKSVKKRKQHIAVPWLYKILDNIVYENTLTAIGKTAHGKNRAKRVLSGGYEGRIS